MGTSAPVTLRPLLFVVHLRPNGAVTAKGMDVDVEISADNLTDLRERLVEELKPFGYAPTLVGMRNEPEIPTA
jgi:hypothetical protein